MTRLEYIAIETLAAHLRRCACLVEDRAAYVELQTAAQKLDKRARELREEQRQNAPLTQGEQKA
jgi:hypothetical protein